LRAIFAPWASTEIKNERPFARRLRLSQSNDRARGGLAACGNSASYLKDFCCIRDATTWSLGEAKKRFSGEGKAAIAARSSIGVFPDSMPGGSRFFLLPGPFASAVANTAMGAHCSVRSTSSSF
jgi:hypothetical protein